MDIRGYKGCICCKQWYPPVSSRHGWEIPELKKSGRWKIMSESATRGFSSSLCLIILKRCLKGTMWGPQDSVQLVYNSNNYGLWYVNNYSYWGESKPTNITGGPHVCRHTWLLSDQLPLKKSTYIQDLLFFVFVCHCAGHVLRHLEGRTYVLSESRLQPWNYMFWMKNVTWWKAIGILLFPRLVIPKSCFLFFYPHLIVSPCHKSPILPILSP